MTRTIRTIFSAVIFMLASFTHFAQAEEKFDQASIRLEQNATDKDAEIVFEVTGNDAGLAALKDGWRLFQASQLNPHARGEEFDIAYLKYEFWFEQLVQADT